MAESERPHVAGDDVLLLFGDVEHLLGVHAGIARVRKAVHLEQAAQAVEGAALVPVVEVKVVQEGPHRQRGLVGVQVQPPVEPEAHPHHVLAVLVGGHIAVLDKLPHALHLGVLIVLLQNGIKLFVFGRRKLHGRSPLSAVRAAKNDQERSCTGLELPKFSACEGFSRFRVRSTRYCLPSPSSSSWASFALADTSSGYHWIRKKFSASTP